MSIPPITPTAAWATGSSDLTPGFLIGLGDVGDVYGGNCVLRSQYATDGVNYSDYNALTLTVSHLANVAATVSASALSGGAYTFRFRIEIDYRGTGSYTNGDWSALVDVILDGSFGGGVDQFSAGDVDRLRRNQEKLKEARESRSKDKGERARKLRDAVEAVYDNLAGIAPAAAAKVAAVIPAKAKVTETEASSATPAIDWSKVTASQIAKVIATMDAYAAQIESERRQQAIARADAARQQDEDDVESLLMSFP